MDYMILELIQKIRTPFLDNFFVFFTRIGNAAEIWLLVILILFINKKTRKLAYFALAALALELALVELVIKPLIQRPRPFIGYDQIELLISAPNSYSFPSGHAASSFAIVAFLYLNNIKYKNILLFMAFLMAFSRLYLFVHFPSDVLVGIIVGTLIAYLVNKLMIKSNNKITNN